MRFFNAAFIAASALLLTSQMSFAQSTTDSGMSHDTGSAMSNPGMSSDKMAAPSTAMAPGSMAKDQGMGMAKDSAMSKTQPGAMAAPGAMSNDAMKKSPSGQ